MPQYICTAPNQTSAAGPFSTQEAAINYGLANHVDPHQAAQPSAAQPDRWIDRYTKTVLFTIQELQQPGQTTPAPDDSPATEHHQLQQILAQIEQTADTLRTHLEQQRIRNAPPQLINLKNHFPELYGDYGYDPIEDPQLTLEQDEDGEWQLTATARFAHEDDPAEYTVERSPSPTSQPANKQSSEISHMTAHPAAGRRRRLERRPGRRQTGNKPAFTSRRVPPPEYPGVL